MKKQFIFLTTVWMFTLLPPARAQSVPSEISYQGVLMDDSGNPANGNVTMTLSLFDTVVGGSALYSENQTVAVRRGLFSVNIGSVTPIPEDLFDTTPRFLDIAINGSAITPRRPMTSVAYAFSSNRVGILALTAQDGLDGIESAGETIASIAANGVTSNKIADGTIAGVDLGNNSVDRSEIADNAVSNIEIANNAVGSSELVNSLDLGEAESADGQLRIFSDREAPFFGSDATIALNPSDFLSTSLVTFDEKGYNSTIINADSEVITHGPHVYVWNVSLKGFTPAGSPFPGDIRREGAIRVYDDGNANMAGIEVTSVVGETGSEGTVYGDVKSFRMSHPYVEDQEIWYATLEGPEAAAYIRGTGRLINGQGLISFPEHFQLVANADDMTVRLTPLDANSTGLAVITKNETGIEVQELRDGTGTYDFDWEVKSVRKGHEGFQVIRKKNTQSTR